jgi:phosphoethanolamine N-methyltransferase
MVLAHSEASAGQDFLDSGQYTRESILKYELVYGANFVSPGGKQCADRLIRKLDLKPGRSVLDVGCGLGGSAFLMKQKFGLNVDAIDLSDNMLELARLRLTKAGLDSQVSLYNQNCLDIEVKNAYDGIYSRDVFLHIKEKEKLFAIFFAALKPFGKLLFTDYCGSEGPGSETFTRYVRQRGYHLCSVPEYRNLIKEAGFEVVEALDVTNQFITFSEAELETIHTLDIDENVRQSLKTDWQRKIDRARTGSQRWGQFLGVKPSEHTG